MAPPPRVATIEAGALFAGRYRIVRCIASGGMGAVYDVIHVETERRRALKVMLPQTLDSDELRERFKREAKIAAHVESEFIVDVFDAGVDEATKMPFLVMELLKGEDLAKHIERRRRFEPSDVVTYLHQTALALDKTHRANIVHRDLKPENLFLTEREDGSPRIKVLDFGIAKVVAEPGLTDQKTTRAFLGTPLYMAPEQYKTGPQLSSATDIYALGMMAYTFLVGHHYWEQEASGEGNVYAFAVVAMKGPTEPATVRAEKHGVTLPHAFNLWFARATAMEPAKRFQVASAAVIELADCLGVESPAARTGLPEAATQALGLSPSKFPPGTTPMPILTPARPPRQAASAGDSVNIPKNSNAPLYIALAVFGILVFGCIGYLVTRRHSGDEGPVATEKSPPVVATETPKTGSADTASPTPAATTAAAPATSVAAVPVADTAVPAATTSAPAPKPAPVASQPKAPKSTSGTRNPPAPTAPPTPNYTRD